MKMVYGLLMIYKQNVTYLARLFFFYLQLRSAMKAYGVPWGTTLQTHPLHKLFASQSQTQGMVSKLYNFISVKLPVEGIWEMDIPTVGEQEIS